MASNFSTIGLPVASGEDINALANRVGPLAERLAAPSGIYFRWSDPSGAEMWLQVNANSELIGMNPHYAGRSAVRVGLTARLPSAGPRELDGSFHGWADPAGDAPDTGCYPFVFDAPDYRLHDELSLPARKEVQIAAFAHEIASWFVAQGYDLAEISSYLGMSVGTLTRIYWHRSPHYQQNISQTAQETPKKHVNRQ